MTYSLLKVTLRWSGVLAGPGLSRNSTSAEWFSDIFGIGSYVFSAYGHAYSVCL